MKLNSKSLIFLAGIGLGLVGATGIINSNLEKKVEKLYEQERSKFEVEVNIQGVDSVYDFSKKEKFISGNADEYYQTKQGFNHRIADVLSVPFGQTEKYIGQKYSYSIETELLVNESPQRLAIEYYSNELFPGSSAFVYASEKDVVNYLAIYDNLNHTQSNIYRNSSGELKFKNLNKDGATKLFDYYQTEFLNFKNKNKIDKKLEEYVPKLEIIKRNVPSQ